MQSISEWLQSLGLEQYAQVFDDNYIDLDVLPSLSELDLEKLGLPMGHRKKLLKAIGKLDDATLALAQTSAIASSDSADVGERRQLTVLFCDMVGFTELASRLDPEVLQTIIHSYEDTCAAAITRYDGYVFQRLGDGIVAFFGYPLAHEGEAERAIRAGLDIIEAFADLDVPEVNRLQVRIGIATGMVVVASAEKGAVGETMNLASRLQGIAPVNTVVVTERVRRLAGGAFEYEDLGEQTLKGIAERTHAYRIVGVSKATSRFEATRAEQLTPLAGRDLELGLLMHRWALAQEGEGQVVLLSGEPGIGKSRVLSVLRERLEDEGANSLRFQCSPYYVNSAFWPMISNFERALKFAQDESAASKLDKLESLIVGHYKRPLNDVRFIASMLSIPCDERYGEVSMAPQKFKDETLRTLVDLTEAAARKKPSVLLFEDLHWADPTSLESLDLLVDRVKDIPMLMVLTHRPEFQNRWSDHGHVSALNLSKLTRTQSKAMVSGLTDRKALPDELLDEILAKTDGVPLFVEELTKSILESGQLNDAGDRYEYVGNDHSVKVPATLRDSLMARLDRYAPVKEIAQVGAAIGREFSYELIAAVAPLTTTQRDEALSQLTESGLAFRRGTPPEAIYTFKHALVQDTAYDSLLKSKRQELHSKIAKALEQQFSEISDTAPEVLAHHLTEAGETEAAVPLWLQAGKRSARTLANSEAYVHISSGLRLLVDLPEGADRDARELDLQMALINPLIAIKGYAAPESKAAYQRAIELCSNTGDTSRMFPALYGLWILAVDSASFARARELAADYLKLASTHKEPLPRLVSHRLMGTSLIMCGSPTIGMNHLEQAWNLFDPVRDVESAYSYGGDVGVFVRAYQFLAASLSGYPDRACQFAQEALARAREIEHATTLAFVLYTNTYTAFVLRDRSVFEQQTVELTSVCDEYRLPEYRAGAVPLQGAVLGMQGRPEEGIETVERGLDRFAGTKLHMYVPCGLLIKVGLLQDLGRSREALAAISDGFRIISTTQERWCDAELHRIRGEIYSDLSEVSEAEAEYTNALTVARNQKAKWWELRTAVSYAQFMRSQNRSREALELLEPVYDWFTEGFDTNDLQEAKALLDELES